MTTPTTAPSYKGFRFPQEIVAHAVGRYHRFALSFRDGEELLFTRGIDVTYETIRQGCREFGSRMPTTCVGDVHSHATSGTSMESFSKSTKTYSLWRAVNQDGNVLDILVQARRNKRSAKKFFRKLLKGCTYVPRVLITDKLASYSAAKRKCLLVVEHRQCRYLNNRAENLHQPTRKREHAMQRFTSGSHAQRMLAAFGSVHEHFCPPRHRLKVVDYRWERVSRFQAWNEVIGLQTAA